MSTQAPKSPLTVAKVTSWLILVLVAGLMAVFLTKSGMFASLFGRKPIQVIDMPLPDQVTSGKSTITGFDKEGQPYRLTSQSVIQDSTNPDLAHLTTVAGELTKKSGKKLNMSSRSGIYNKETKILNLLGNIILISPNEYTAYLEKARVTLKDKRLYATVPVTVIFDRGSIKSNGLEISENGKRVFFFGHVKTRFNSALATASKSKTDKKGN